MRKIALFLLTFIVAITVLASCGGEIVTTESATTESEITTTEPEMTTTQPAVTTTEPEVTTTAPESESVEPPTEETYSQGLIYRLNTQKTGYMVVGIGNCMDTDVVLPEKYQNLPVVEIVDEAFSDCKTLYTIVIPDTVKKIGYAAFKGCSKLEDVVIGCGVTSIGAEAFESCGSLTSITIPDNVECIGFRAFYHCTKLAHITLPFVGNGNADDWGALEPMAISSPMLTASEQDSRDKAHFGYIFGASSYLENGSCVPASLKTIVITGGKRIGERAFYNCGGLTSVQLPDEVTAIGEYAFQKCGSLISIIVPDKVTDIGDYAFEDCVSLKSVVLSNSSVDVGVSAFSGCYSLQYNVFDNGRYLGNQQNPYVILMGATSATVTSIAVASETQSIYYGALSDCSKLTSIVLSFVGNTKDGKSNTHFGYLFGASTYENNAACVPTSLKTVVITGGAHIGEGAFYGCSTLTGIKLPNDLISIGSKAFNGCGGLTDIAIPSSVTSIGTSAFYACNALARVDITDIAKWCEITFGGLEANPLYKAGKLYLNGVLVKDLVIPEGVERIGDYAFCFYHQLTSVTIPDGVVTIGKGAFWYCTRLASVTIGKGTTSIGNAAFRYCPGLTVVTIPEGVQSVGVNAFAMCENLTDVTIPESVTYIGKNAFSDCSNLENVYITDIEAWCLITFENTDANPLTYADKLYLNGTLVTAFPS